MMHIISTICLAIGTVVLCSLGFVLVFGIVINCLGIMSSIYWNILDFVTSKKCGLVCAIAVVFLIAACVVE